MTAENTVRTGGGGRQGVWRVLAGRCVLRAGLREEKEGLGEAKQ